MFIQCPECGTVYKPVSVKHIHNLLKNNPSFFKILKREQNRRIIDQFRYCRLCGTRSSDFVDTVDHLQNPTRNIFPILY